MPPNRPAMAPPGRGFGLWPPQGASAARGQHGPALGGGADRIFWQPQTGFFGRHRQDFSTKHGRIFWQPLRAA